MSAIAPQQGPGRPQKQFRHSLSPGKASSWKDVSSCCALTGLNNEKGERGRGVRPSESVCDTVNTRPNVITINDM